VEYRPSKKMLVDSLTKALSLELYKQFVAIYNLIDIKHLIELYTN
jgi:hypothetical protein